MESSLTRLIHKFEEAEQSSMPANDLSRRCRNYYDGDQLTGDELSELSKRGQPPVVVNLIRKEINWMRGYEMQSRVDPRAFPRNPNDEELAGAATDALRYVSDSVNYDKLRSKVWESLIIEGIGGVEVIHEMQPPMREPKIVVNRYAWDRLFYDPYSAEDDFSDARYKGAVIWSDMEDLKEQYPGKEDYIDGSLGPTDVSSDTYEDKPYYRVWSDPARRRIRVVLMHYLSGGKWKWAKFCKGGILEEGESAYVDEYGESQCPLVMMSMYVAQGNERHSVVKDYLDPQDEVNKRRSKLLHQMNSRQTWGPAGAVRSVKAMKHELAKPDGHIEVTAEATQDSRETGVMPFNIIPTHDQVAGQFQLLQESKANIEVMGANSALMGQGSASSGRQVMAEQQGGLVEIAPVYGQLLHFDDMVYRQMWMRVRQFWSEEKWIRVTDDDRNIRFVGLNKQVTLQEELGKYSQEEVAFFAQRHGIVPGDPRLQQVVRVENQVATMDVDIIIEDVPDTVTLQGETFEQLVNLSTSQPGSVPTEILVEAAPNLDRDIKEKLMEHLDQQKQQQAQMGQVQMQVAEAEKQADIQKKQSEAVENMAQAQKIQGETLYPAAVV